MMALRTSSVLHFVSMMLCLTMVTSFVYQRSMPMNMHKTYMIARATLAPHDDQLIPTSTPQPIPEEDAVAMNMKMHQAAVDKSESTFYGYYPEGFTEFDYDQCPLEWTSYSLEEKVEGANPTFTIAASSNADMITSYPSTIATNDMLIAPNIWDTFLQLDKRIVPPPFKSSDLAKVSQTPTLTRDECNNIISECENHYYGWGSSNERYGTPSNRVGYMLPLENLSFSYTFVNFELLPRLFPAISLAFADSIKLHPENLRLGGCRVVKYDAADGHVELGMHRDGLLMTANIALNDIDEYEGGGTIIEGLEEPIRLPVGHALLHPGDVKHGGYAITSGVRYALVCFIFDTTMVPHEKYCQDRMKADVDAALLIPNDDMTRADERMRLLSSATKHCADAYKFGKLSCGDICEDGYDEIVNHFGSRYPLSL